MYIYGCKLPVRNMRGFTLIELVVVMVLIGVTMAFALPRLSNFVFSDPLKQTTRKLTLLITQTSRLAVRTSRPYFLEYDSQTRRFKVLPVEKKEPGEEDLVSDEQNHLPTLQLPDSVLLTDVSFAAAEKKISGPFSLRFSEKGYLEPCLIHLQDQRGDEMTLKLSPFVGHVTLHQGYVSLEEDTFR